jgi:hypothetical protein
MVAPGPVETCGTIALPIMNAAPSDGQALQHMEIFIHIQTTDERATEVMF